MWKRMFAGTALEAWLRAPSPSLRVGRLPRAAWPLVVGSLARATAETGRNLLVLVPAPERFLDELRLWLAGRPSSYLFSEVKVSFLDRPPAFDEATGRRLEALVALAAEEPCVVVSSRRAALRMTMAPADLADTSVLLVPHGKGDPAAVAGRLVELGYSREALVEAPGQFSLRGGILDVFPTAGRSPVRAEWFGDEVESLRIFDPHNQRSVMEIPRLTVRPGKEVLMGPARGAAAAGRIGEVLSLEALRADVRADWDDDLRRLAAGSPFPGVEFFASYLNPRRPSLFDHLGPQTLVADLEPQRQRADLEEQAKEVAMLVAAESENGELPPGFQPPMVPLERLLEPPVPRLEIVAAEAEDAAVDLGWSGGEPVVGQPQALAAVIAAGLAGATVVFATEQRDRLRAALAEAGSDQQPEPVDLDLDLQLRAGLFWGDADIPAGGRHGGHRLWLLTDAELFGRVRRPAVRPRRRGRPEAVLSLEFQPEDFVVHVDHGIARFKGMRLIEQDGAEREYLELQYAEGDRLFVPVESLDRVQKYLGGGEGEIALHRMGTGDWERARGRARRSTQDVADELLKIYSAREARPGFAFAADTPWQGELEAAFPYEETPDQLLALAEIKGDMESERAMDRLICGDVGFGKTELAVRAAFKAVMSGRQVALLAPTTVLAQQHFQVFGERLRPYPVQIDMLSRFRSDEEQAQTLLGLKSGQVDIVIGTHRLLQRDVRFKRLGLVVVDEEQRFGVMQKERFKRMRAHVDVLSLSATPIPRTLHMSLVGIRDMSVIQTPPEDRQPIKTYVTADDDDLVREVISRELDRGGQVYFVHNRVRTIQKTADRLARLMPTARIAVGHGQMEEMDLARVMVEFAAGRHDILVCTTIIESGLDIPNVNTLVVERADRFGLSQLYQLRGRVGRAGKRAYAYFLYDPARSLTETADKRLDVISGLHELGQGFKIALRDLEIRGAGNLLGVEQHGAIAAVGFEMYMQMLQAAVARLKLGGEEVEAAGVLSTPEMNLDLPLDHFIPRSYIRDERLRLAAYRELAQAEDEETLEANLRSLRDRYGTAPPQLENLAYSLRVKIRGQRLGLRSVVVESGLVVVRVDPERVLDTDELRRRFGEELTIGPNRLRLKPSAAGWGPGLLRLLDDLEEVYGRARISSDVR